MARFKLIEKKYYWRSMSDSEIKIHSLFLQGKYQPLGLMLRELRDHKQICIRDQVIFITDDNEIIRKCVTLFKCKNDIYIGLALMHLSNVCDGASSLDGVGFNNTDTNFGHSLADLLNAGFSISVEQEITALKMLKKYAKQIEKAGLISPTEESLKFSQAVHFGAVVQ